MIFMLLFSEYQNLPHRIKPLATQMWVNELFARTGAKNRNQLPFKLGDILGDKDFSAEKNSQNFFNKKLRGQVLRNDNCVFKIETALPGSSANLFSPMWQLLINQRTLSFDEITMLSTRIFNTEFGDGSDTEGSEEMEFKADYYELCNVFESVVTLIFMHELSKCSDPNHDDSKFEIRILNAIFILFATRYRISKGANLHTALKLCQLLSELFTKPKYDCFAQTIVLADEKSGEPFEVKSFPTKLCQVKSVGQVVECCEAVLIIGKLITLYRGYEGLWMSWMDIRNLSPDKFHQFVSEMTHGTLTNPLIDTINQFGANERSLWDMNENKEAAIEQVTNLWSIHKSLS